jgi:ATP-dependent helicase/nuclease subunit B
MDELSENKGVQVRFLLGPAGTGKTFQCLEEIRAELKRAPEGPPLLFVAPKQATFQIERQLLSDPELPGYTRLQILSFDRLAEFVMESLGEAAVRILSEEGRVMVLRALLAEKQNALRTFRSTARLPGFAQQLSALLRELQQQRLSSATLMEAAQDPRTAAALRDKLQDVALLLDAYREWLEANGLHDTEQLLELAADALTSLNSRTRGFQPGMLLWLDGFAEMTPQELHLLAAFAPLCERATLAFCLENDSAEESGSWLSHWSVVAHTFRNCRDTFAAMPQCNVHVKALGRDAARSRFSGSPMLAHIEQHWAAPVSLLEDNTTALRQRSVRVVMCANAEAEAVFAAREILRFVRERGARFRDCAVLLRSLDGYHAVVRRVFTRYGVPFFLDRRESIAHHPLAELTRFALRVAAFGWRNEDWFGVLKTGLVHRSEDDIDQIENEALARGWNGAQWIEPLPGSDGKVHPFEPLRGRLAPPFEKLSRAVAGIVNGPQLAAAIRALWAELDVETTLCRWADELKQVEPSLPPMHETVLSQMEIWLENVERAFASQALGVKDWLPILEAGLAGLTVGVIPPSLDQVLVGAIDRSRNPDLRLTVVLGMNETIFPAPPPRAPILTEFERKMLGEWVAGRKQSLGFGAHQRIAHERFYGYIACTRSREQLVLTCAAANTRGVALNPSPFLAHLERLAPGVFPAKAEEREHFATPDWRDAQHVCEVAAPLISGMHPELEALKAIESLAPVVRRSEQFNSAAQNRRRNADGTLRLAPSLVARLFPSPLTTSVSALEDFAACPFKFFLKHGLRIKERDEFEIDHRQKGIFQHEVLSRFHERATADGKRWRDWSAPDAAALARAIGRELLKKHHYGLFDVDDGRRFTGEVLLENVERLVSTLVTWMEHYQFDPRAVELEFGLGKSPLPGWRLPLNDGRELVLCGRIDRIDVCEREGTPALGIVMDYKSSGKKVDAAKLYNGLELQLLSYLGFLRQLSPSAHLPQLVPAGVFYVGLRGSADAAQSRGEVFENPEATGRSAFRHEGRFDGAWHAHLDGAGCEEQFSSHYTVKLAPEAFTQLMVDVEAHLKRLGAEILDGKISIEPYRKNQRDTACVHCEFKCICRFDPWIEPYRALKSLPKAQKKTKEGKVKA